MSKNELRELIEAIENSHYDRRRKTGEDSFATFSTGTRFILEYHDEHSPLAGFAKKVTLVQSNVQVNHTLLVKLFYASSRVVEPKTVEDLTRIHGIAPKFALEELLSTGRVKVADIDKAMATVNIRFLKEMEDQLKAVSTAETGTVSENSSSVSQSEQTTNN